MEKVIWIFWAQGWRNAPPIAKASLNSWKHLNPDWRVKPLDRESDEYEEVKKFCQGKNLKWAAKSDLLRLSLMEKYGGVWVDATTICLKSLDDWVHEQMKPLGFFLFKKDESVSSWFLASEKGSSLASEWHRRGLDYFSERKSPDTYLWVHRLFDGMLSEGLGKGLAFLSASIKRKEGPHMLVPVHEAGKKEVTRGFMAHFLKESPPLLKLSKAPFKKGSQVELFVKPYLK